MGFNNLGAEVVARRVEAARGAGLPQNFRIGINLGKNKDTPGGDAHEDYRRALTPFRGLVDYAVINVSSPNTPGLRDLQRPELLRPIVQSILEELGGWPKSVPLLLKCAPELSSEDLEELIPAAEAWGISGFVLTNTLQGTFPGRGSGSGILGGWSGAPVRDASLIALRRVRGLTGAPVISVGGIQRGPDAQERREAGANLIQIYSGWIFEGPHLPQELAREFGMNSTP
jgi:dihydroorotate dehydrogenase